MRIGIIDIGTNSVLLLLAKEGQILDISEISRIGEGLKEDGIIKTSSMERTIKVLERFKEYLKDAEVVVFGTHVLRVAKNSRDFLELVKKKIGLDIKILSPFEEAFYTYLSVKFDGSIPFYDFLIWDIGGGSTEVISGTKQRFEDFVSLPIGSVNLTETFIKSDPPKDEEVLSLRAFLRQIFSKDLRNVIRRDKAVGIGGTVTNVALILEESQSFDRSLIHGKRIKIEEIGLLIDELKSMTKEERERIKGIEKKRADIILAGLILLEELLFFFSLEELFVSTYGARYGILFERTRR